jgi:hypothetical protein
VSFAGNLPKRPGAIESIVTAMRAQSAGGRVKMAADAKSLILEVTAANPATRKAMISTTTTAEQVFAIFIYST